MSSFQLNTGACSRAGLRAFNHDAYGLWPREALLTTSAFWAALSDGVGSSAEVLEVSRSAVKLALQSVSQQRDEQNSRESLSKAFVTANQWLRGAYKNRYATLTLLEIKNATLSVAHVGDTRLYRWRDGTLTCLTQDHRSVAADMGGGLTRALGLSEKIEPAICQFAIQKYDRYVLLSDGVYDCLSSAQLQTLLQQSDDAQAIADELVTQALQYGSQDNASALVVDVLELNIEFDANTPEFETWPLSVPPSLGDNVDSYLIEALIAKTGSHHIFRALDKISGKHYALKFANDLPDRKMVARANLAHEIALGNHLRLPYLVTALSFNRQRQSGLYAVFDYIDGKTIQSRDARRYGLAQLLKIGITLAERVHQMHQIGYVHADIKPENILRGSDNELYLIDFSLARSIADATTASGGGTPTFMAPELWQDARVSAQSDQFALAVTLYALATVGQTPYGDIEIFSTPSFKHYRVLRELRPDLPVWFELVLIRALQRDPKQRYSDCRELANALKEGQQHGIGLSDVRRNASLLERDPLRFYQSLSLILGGISILFILLYLHK